MSTSRKDFIQIAEGCISAIKSGYVKKKDIYSFINTMAGACKMTNHNFDYDKFREYIIKGIK